MKDEALGSWERQDFQVQVEPAGPWDLRGAGHGIGVGALGLGAASSSERLRTATASQLYPNMRLSRSVGFWFSEGFKVELYGCQHFRRRFQCLRGIAVGRGVIGVRIARTHNPFRQIAERWMGRV